MEHEITKPSDRHFDTIACGDAAETGERPDAAMTLAALCGGVRCALYVGNDAEILMDLLTGSDRAQSTSFEMCTTLAPDVEGKVQVGSVRTWLGQQSGILHIVYNGAASPYLCRPLLMGADIVIEDLRGWVSAALLEAAHVPSGPIYAVIARTQTCWETLGSLCSCAALTPWSESGSAALAAALETLSLSEQRRFDTALALAHYLAAHPHVVWVSYPGLSDDPSHVPAQHTLEHGFGPLLTCGLMPDVSSHAVLGSQPYDAHHTTVATGPKEGSLIIRTGLEHPLDVVAMVEHVVNA